MFIHHQGSQTLHQAWPSVEKKKKKKKRTKKKNKNPELLQSPQRAKDSLQTLLRTLRSLSLAAWYTIGIKNFTAAKFTDTSLNKIPVKELLSTGQWNIHWTTLPFFPPSLSSNFRSAGDGSLKSFRTFVAWFRLIRRSFRSQLLHLLYYPRYEAGQGYTPAKFL